MCEDRSRSAALKGLPDAFVDVGSVKRVGDVLVLRMRMREVCASRQRCPALDEQGKLTGVTEGGASRTSGGGI